jgi:superfamily II DNA or RNA helicase
MGFVTTQLPVLTAAMSRYPYSEALEHFYTFESTYGDTVVGSIKVGNTLLVPRESVPYAPPPSDYRTAYVPKPVPCHFTPRNEEQAKLALASLKALQHERSHIFDAPTGWGKTVVGGYIAASFGQPTLIVVTKEDLMHQWYDSLTKILKIPPSMIGRVQGEICEWEGKRFVLGMVQSLMIEGKYPPDMVRSFGLMLLDEVHSMAADCFIRVCQTFPAKYRLGFSATPTRKDGKTQLLHWHIGPIMSKGKILETKPKVLVRQTGWCIPTRRKLVGDSWEQVPIPYKPGRMMTVTKAIAASNTRNMEIANFVLQSYKSGRMTLVVSDLRENHLNRLFQILTNEGIPGQDIGYYVGGMSKIELSHTKQRRVVLGTYQMCSTGTDVPQWDTLVMATPRADIKQTIGRILRTVEGKKQPVILDLVDRDAIFQGFHHARLKQYYGIGAEVVKV